MVMKQKKKSLIIAAVSLTVVLVTVLLVLLFKNPSVFDVSQKMVLATCPFEVSDNAEWKFYPSNNLVGFTALAKDYDETDQTFILVFNHSPKQKGSDRVILNGTLDSQCYYENFEFDNQEIIKRGNLYYMKMKCDKRITVVSFGFNLENGDIREYARVQFLSYDSSPVMKLSYARYDYSYPQKTKNIRREQFFNEETGRWSEIRDIEETQQETGIQYSRWTELQVDDPAGKCAVTRSGAIIDISRYDYTRGTYNVYHETKDPQVTTLRFLVATQNDTSVEDIEEFDINNINTEDIRLYVRDGIKYVDITPGDFYIGTTSSNLSRVGDSDVWFESCRFIDLNSNELGELGEHDYRLVIEGYAVDFTLSIQTFEVW